MEISAALVTSAEAPFAIEPVELEAPRADEVLVRVVGVGICHTDIVLKGGLAPFPLPAVLGHEGSGVVEAVGKDVSAVAVGDHVVMSFLSCGHCGQCEADAPAYCGDFMLLNYSGARPDGSAPLSRDGQPLGSHFFGQSSFATHALARERSLVRVDKDLPLEILGPLGCGIQTGAGAVLRSLDLPRGSTLLVAGAGAVGLRAVMAARLRDCRRIIVIEPAAERRALALELGATEAFAPAPGLEAQVLALVPAGVDAALDTSGNPESLAVCLASLGIRGVLGLLGSAAPDTPLPGHVNGVLSRGQSIRGIIEGDSNPQAFIPQLLDYYRAGKFPFDRMMRSYPFAEINRAVEDHAAGRAVKAVLLMGRQ